MNQIRVLTEIPWGYMIIKNQCDKCKLMKGCTYEQLGFCFAVKNQKDQVEDENPDE